MHEGRYPQGVTGTNHTPSGNRRYDADRLVAWYAVMVNAYEHLSESDRAAVDRWDNERVGLSTSDWPRWGEFIDLDLFWPWPWPPGTSLETVSAAAPTAPEGGCYLYRLWCDDGRLLYVGVSTRLRARLASHRRRWPDLWTEATWEEHPDEATMLAAERHAIANEDPALNRAGIR